jgi:hypothetical protein
MKRCPYCKKVVGLYIGKYRCGECHLWLEQEECLEIEAELLPIEVDVANHDAKNTREANVPICRC